MFIYCKPWIHYCIFTGLCAINPLDSYYSLYNGFHSSLKTWGKLAAGTQRLASRLFLKNPSCLCVNLLLGTKSNSIWQALFFTSTTRYLYTEIIPGLPRTHDSLKRPQILFFKCAVFFFHIYLFLIHHTASMQRICLLPSYTILPLQKMIMKREESGSLESLIMHPPHMHLSWFWNQHS